MISTVVENYLIERNAQHEVIIHTPEYTAQDVARVTHIHGINMGKVVALKADGELLLALIPAHYYIDFDLMAEEMGAFDVELASEDEFQSTFPECELGAMPPFADLWNVPLYMSEAFHPDERIAFNAGTWSELIAMDFDEFVEISKPLLIYDGAVSPGRKVPAHITQCYLH